MIWGFRGARSPWGSFLLAACKKAQSDSLSRGTPMVGECRLTQTFPAKSGLYQRGLQVDCLKAEHPLFLFAPWMRRLLSACPPLYFSPILAEAFGVQYRHDSAENSTTHLDNFSALSSTADKFGVPSFKLRGQATGNYLWE